jgi:NAD(P)-dependent dehydrogenase (short-subunit alcohol dehydrogenase family)
MSTVLLTGCSSGFGYHAALAFARQGHEVFATVRTLERAKPLQDAADEEDLDLHVVRLDVRDADSVDGAVAEVMERAGRIDICVNNAGIELRGPIEECSDDEVLVQFDTNVFGLLRVVRAVIPIMREQGGGVIVNVGSLAGLVSRPFAGIYSASKHAVEAITEALHFECGLWNIRLAVIEPGQFETALANNALVAAQFDASSPYKEASDRFDVAVRTLAPDGKPAPPEVVADAIVEVAEDDNATLRRLVGADAELIWSVRNGSDFEQYEYTMRSALNFWE